MLINVILFFLVVSYENTIIAQLRISYFFSLSLHFHCDSDTSYILQSYCQIPHQHFTLLWVLSVSITYPVWEQTY